MALELVLLAQGDEHGHGDQAAGFQVQARALPDVAPGVACDVLLDGRGELGGAAEGAGHEVFAHHLLAGGQAFVELGIHGVKLLQNQAGIMHESFQRRPL
jgi:hypothetical protein